MLNYITQANLIYPEAINNQTNTPPPLPLPPQVPLEAFSKQLNLSVGLTTMLPRQILYFL